MSERERESAYHSVNFAASLDNHEKIKTAKKIDKNLDLARKQKKALEQESNGDKDCCLSACNGIHRFGKETRRNRNPREN